MSDNGWAFDYAKKIFSIMKSKVKADIGANYPNLFFTMTDKVDSTPKFPTVYFHELKSREIANDLENDSINGVDANFQIEVYSNISQSDAEKVMSEVLSVMKELRFAIRLMPIADNGNDTFRLIARVEKYLANMDIL